MTVAAVAEWSAGLTDTRPPPPKHKHTRSQRTLPNAAGFAAAPYTLEAPSPDINWATSTVNIPYEHARATLSQLEMISKKPS